jgi:hypothetical protein
LFTWCSSGSPIDFYCKAMCNLGSPASKFPLLLLTGSKLSTQAATFT